MLLRTFRAASFDCCSLLAPVHTCKKVINELAIVTILASTNVFDILFYVLIKVI